MSNRTCFRIKVQNDMNLHPSRDINEEEGGREEYHLSPGDGDIQSEKVYLNGHLLSVTEGLEIPEMRPKLVDPSTDIIVAPHSFLFALLKDFKAPTCMT